MWVSHETIYKSLFVQTRGVLAKELQKHLRSGRPTRRNVHNTVTGQWRSQIRDAVSIRLRPAEIEDRAVLGHWEGDLLLGRHWTQIATVVERSTRFTVLVQLDGRDMETVTAGLSRTMTRLPEQLRRSLTWDRGMELAGHKNVTENTGLDVYFADPRSRGSAERTRTPTAYFANTYPRTPAWPGSPRTTSMRSQPSSTPVRARLSTRTLQPIGSPHCCTD
jgi:IS30 family transposase